MVSVAHVQWPLHFDPLEVFLTIHKPNFFAYILLLALPRCHCTLQISLLSQMPPGNRYVSWGNSHPADQAYLDVLHGVRPLLDQIIDWAAPPPGMGCAITLAPACFLGCACLTCSSNVLEKMMISLMQTGTVPKLKSPKHSMHEGKKTFYQPL